MELRFDDWVDKWDGLVNSNGLGRSVMFLFCMITYIVHVFKIDSRC